MTDRPIFTIPAESWEDEGGSLGPDGYAESLGITSFLSETYVVGGYSFTNLGDAIAQGHRMKTQPVTS